MKNRLVLTGILALALSLYACAAKVEPPISLADDVKPDLKTSSPIKAEVAGKAVATARSESAGSVRFVVSADSRGSDTGVHEKQMRSVMKQIKKLDPQPSLMVVIGDLIQGDTNEQKNAAQYEVWKKLAKEFYPLDFYYPAVGNHEMTIRAQEGLDAFSSAFSDMFEATFYGQGYGKSVYYFDRGNARFFVVNNYHPEHRHAVAADVVQWMRDNTDESKAFHFVFSHAPGWPAGAHIGDSLDAYPKRRDIFWQAVDAMPGAIFFAGHEHNYSRTQIDAGFSETVDGTSFRFKNTIQQVIVGGLGATLQKGFKAEKGVIVPPRVVYCYCVVDVFADRTRVQAFDADGNKLDDFEVKAG